MTYIFQECDDFVLYSNDWLCQRVRSVRVASDVSTQPTWVKILVGHSVWNLWLIHRLAVCYLVLATIYRLASSSPDEEARLCWISASPLKKPCGLNVDRLSEAYLLKHHQGSIFRWIQPGFLVWKNQTRVFSYLKRRVERPYINQAGPFRPMRWCK